MVDIKGFQFSQGFRYGKLDVERLFTSYWYQEVRTGTKMRQIWYLMLLSPLVGMVKAANHKFSHIAMDYTKLENSTTLRRMEEVICSIASVLNGDYLFKILEFIQ